MFSVILETLSYTMGSLRSTTSDAGNAPNKLRKVMMLQEKLIDLYCRLRFTAVVVHQFKTNESSLRTMDKNKEKEI